MFGVVLQTKNMMKNLQSIWKETLLFKAETVTKVWCIFSPFLIWSVNLALLVIPKRLDRKASFGQRSENVIESHGFSYRFFVPDEQFSSVDYEIACLCLSVCVSVCLEPSHIFWSRLQKFMKFYQCHFYVNGSLFTNFQKNSLTFTTLYLLFL